MESNNRKTAIINLDPANDILPYKCAVDISDLIDLSKVMEEENLGPNGGKAKLYLLFRSSKILFIFLHFLSALVFCIEFIRKNIDWLIDKLQAFNDHYLLFDCPGQIELYTHDNTMRKIVHELQDVHSYRLTAVHLVDSFYCSQPTTFVSVLLTSLSTMLKLELPHVNVLSKIDAVLCRGDLGKLLTQFFLSSGNVLT